MKYTYSRISKFLNLDVQDFGPTVQPFATSSNELWWGHVRGKIDSPLLLLLHRSLSTQLSSALHQMRLTAFVLYGIRLSFKHSMYLKLPKWFVFLLLVFHKFLQPNMWFTLQTDSDIHDSFLNLSHRHQDNCSSWSWALPNLQLVPQYTNRQDAKCWTAVLCNIFDENCTFTILRTLHLKATRILPPVPSYLPLSCASVIQLQHFEITFLSPTFYGIWSLETVHKSPSLDPFVQDESNPHARILFL